MRSILLCVSFASAAAFIIHCGGGDDSSGAGPLSDAGAGTDSPVVVVNDSGPTDSGPVIPRVDVNGLVYGKDPDHGPLPSRDVVVIDALGAATKVVSGVDGKFQVLGVATPYDVVAPYEVADAATPAYQNYYAGLTRPDPAIYTTDYADFVPVYHTATVTFTLNACLNCIVSIQTPTDPVGDAVVGTGVATAYSTVYQWTGASNTTSVPFHMTVRQPNKGPFVSALQISPQTLTDGQTDALGTIVGAPLPAASVALTSTLPTGFAASGPASAEVRYPDGSSGGSGELAAAAGSIPIPGIAGTKVDTELRILGPQGYSSGLQRQPYAAALTTNFVFPVPSVPLTPADHATGVTDAQTLTWSPLSLPGYYALDIVTPQDGDFHIVTTATSFDLSRFTKAGIPLPGVGTYTWKVQSVTQLTSIDAYAVLPGAAPPNSELYYVTDSNLQSFTTK